MADMGNLQRRQALIFGSKKPLPSEEELQQAQDQAAMDAAQDKLAMGQKSDDAPSAANLWGFGSGKKIESAPNVDLTKLSPEELIAYFQQQNSRK